MRTLAKALGILALGWLTTSCNFRIQPPPGTATPTPVSTPTAPPVLTATATAPPAVATPTVVANGCAATPPGVKFMNGGNACAPYVPVPAGFCGVDMTWWYNCDDTYRRDKVYRKTANPNVWVPDSTPPDQVACWQGDTRTQHFTYVVGELRKVCETPGATACDDGHRNNPGMVVCCKGREWKEDKRRGVVTAVDASGTPLEVQRNIRDNPSFSAIRIAHPGQVISVTYCLPPPPLIDEECGTEFAHPGPSGCTVNVFVP